MAHECIAICHRICFGKHFLILSSAVRALEVPNRNNVNNVLAKFTLHRKILAIKLLAFLIAVRLGNS